MFPTFDAFSQVMDQCTQNYECLVVNNNTQSNKLEDMVYWYKAENHQPFKMGAPEFWQHHSNNYTEQNKDTDEIDITQIRKKNSLNVSVKKTH